MKEEEIAEALRREDPYEKIIPNLCSTGFPSSRAILPSLSSPDSLISVADGDWFK
jgi:hypothetical protein